ncbi:TraR/DksA C4-type zinc finger protein [Roseospira visakhapatnamensis]|uniref:Phage/conjugal plasmid C-4 type zinc finger TraR family protein n=1 Tax=Roseospira visakhapatnamensis TaxID=390880 RepID=A0A7W6RH08_9PROT|nr:TraR/DksA C4-type zinc finger protein [Roseospira visakhapatnamensis]MBB4268167.1 phage/conjugal plasmid C-4 type zinc finger TraR family protein [Roseospira visakhapatnamensis]
MADLADIAGDLAERDRAESLALHAARTAHPRPTSRTPADRCAGCGQPIPAARRAAHPAATRCAPCQAAAEVRRTRQHRTGVW